MVFLTTAAVDSEELRINILIPPSPLCFSGYSRLLVLLLNPQFLHLAVDSSRAKMPRILEGEVFLPFHIRDDFMQLSVVFLLKV